MPWARFDDRFPSHRKVRLLSDAAFRLYVSAVCWSAENLTDGVVKTNELRLVADIKSASRRAKELVDSGLWETLPGVGWLIHDYAEYNPTAEQVRAERKAKAARQQRWRDKQKDGGPRPTPPDDKRRVDASTDTSLDASRDGAKDDAPRARVPDPTPNYVMADVSGSSAGSRSADVEHVTAPIDDSGFQLTDGLRRWALQTYGPGINLDHEYRQFVLHHRGQMTNCPNWYATFQKWVGRSAKWASENAQRPQLRAVSGGYQPYKAPDESIYAQDEGF
jgi:hypothetical protein